MITLKAISSGAGGKTRQPVNLFFIEMIVSLLFFSISGAVVLRVFASADLKSRRSTEFESVILCAQSAAEVYSRDADAENAIKTVFGGELTESGNCGYIMLDGKSFNAAENGTICLKVSENTSATAAGKYAELTLDFAEGDREIYSLVCSAYVPFGGVEDE